jgi:hypothetical protein
MEERGTVNSRPRFLAARQKEVMEESRRCSCLGPGRGRAERKEHATDFTRGKLAGASPILRGLEEVVDGGGKVGTCAGTPSRGHVDKISGCLRSAHR